MVILTHHADNNLTTDKALNSVSSVAAANPSKVYVLVGLNDLNYGTRSGENVAERIGSIVESLKEAIPSVKVYVVSLLPITQSFEAKSNVKITQAHTCSQGDRVWNDIYRYSRCI